ncbi:hypothetical protein C8F04DRAFT_1183723 [Mycena alexandri]|uniref:Uncharacterized protein n=1 Tax=Mycena alexandri TaxID=1745969 RepID=A0AAD6SYA0_9AGAR|nr:hypothetical protein C8F04DRAFT_1183723 [Mycena alexandri]
MPASRTKKCSVTAQTNASVPVPRITDPYAPRDEDDVYPETSAEKAATEEVRADFNRKIVLLQKKHETLVAATSTSNATGADEGAERDAAIFDMQAYEDIYGKFLPDADVSEWMVRKKIRETELLKLREAAGGIGEHDHQDMVLYLAREGAFEDDFGHEFSGNDGLDGHFKRMALHASSAQELALCHDNDKPRMLAAAALPVTFDIYNPYKEGHPDREAFDETFRGYMPAYWKNDPPAGNGNPNADLYDVLDSRPTSEIHRRGFANCSAVPLGGCRWLSGRETLEYSVPVRAAKITVEVEIALTLALSLSLAMTLIAPFRRAVRRLRVGLRGVYPFGWQPQIDGVCGGPGVPSSDDKIKPQFPLADTMKGQSTTPLSISPPQRCHFRIKISSTIAPPNSATPSATT